ncbi:WD40-repeat-containing domain protein [Mrakia frigida]|uniref:WD40-repeat-containing domain protein n=1 Tax=Mrakia frigida TaxID=29902 RepID=UPI003FCBF6C4
MHLARHSVSSVPVPSFNSILINHDGDHFAVATDQGFEVWKLYPLANVARRALPGSISHASLLHRTSLVFLLGGGSNPLYPPNKLVVWDDRKGKAVLELEFREKILGLSSRRGSLALAFRRRVVLFSIDGWEQALASGKPLDPKGKGRAREQDIRRSGSGGGMTWVGEWETCENSRGLVSLSTSPGSTLLAIPGRQAGHVHLLHLHPCPSALPSSSAPLQSPPQPTSPPPPPPKSTIIITHTTALSSLSCPPSGIVLSTSSERGTLIRIWDGRTGALVRELRRGSDKAIIWGVGWRRDGRRLGVWSDKGTVHVFSLEGAGSEGEGVDKNRPSALSLISPYLPVSLPRYFSSEWSHAQYRLPSRNPHAETLSLGSHDASSDGGEEKCVVGWIEVASGKENVSPPHLPRSSSSSSSSPRRSSVGKVVEEDRRKRVVSHEFGSKGVRTLTPTPSSSSPSRGASTTTPSSTSASAVEHQLVALTYSGGWYRLALPSSSSTPLPPSSSSSHSRRESSELGGDGDDEDAKPGVQCRLVEFRRFGQESAFGAGFGSS